MKHLLVFCAVVILCSPGLALAQTAPMLTLHQAEQAALRRHPELLAAQAGALASKQVVREARSNYFPTISADITASAADRDSRLAAGYLSNSRLLNRFAQGITIDQLITDSGRRKNLVASFRLSALAAQQSTQATREDVLAGVDQAYFEVLRAEALLRVARQTVSERQVVMDQVSAMVKNKLKSNLDLSFANVNLTQAKLLQIQAQNNITIAKAQLARAMGLETPRPFTLEDQPTPSAPPTGAAPLVAEALQKRPEIAALSLASQAAHKFERAERDLSFPTVAAVGVAGYVPEVEQLTLPRAIPDHYEAAGVDVQVPIFNGHLFAARRQAALLKAQAADDNLRDMRQRIARDVRVAWANAVTAYQQIGAANQLLSQAKLAFSLAQGRYNLGLGSIVELSQAQLNETEAQIQAVNARYDFQTRNAELQRQTGTLQ